MFNTNLFKWENLIMVAAMVVFTLWFLNKTGIVRKKGEDSTTD